MKNMPVSLWLSWTNRAAAIWMQTAMAVARQQQAAMLPTMRLTPARRPHEAPRPKRRS